MSLLLDMDFRTATRLVLNMGNTKSNQPQVISGMKRLQEDSDVQQLYKLVDMHGGGELLPWMKYTKQTGDHTVLDGLLDSKVC